MYTEENYLWGLVAYYVGVLLFLAGCWYFTKRIPWKHPRRLLLLLVAAIFLVPIKAYPELHHLAPAFFIAVFEGITHPEQGSYLRGFIPLLTAYIAAVVCYTAINSYLFWKKRSKQHTSIAKPNQEAEGNSHGTT